MNPVLNNHEANKSLKIVKSIYLWKASISRYRYYYYGEFQSRTAGENSALGVTEIGSQKPETELDCLSDLNFYE